MLLFVYCMKIKIKKIKLDVYCIRCYKHMNVHHVETEALNEDLINEKKFRMSCPKCKTVIDVTAYK